MNTSLPLNKVGSLPKWAQSALLAYESEAARGREATQLLTDVMEWGRIACQSVDADTHDDFVVLKERYKKQISP